jgi:hypothetical protein
MWLIKRAQKMLVAKIKLFTQLYITHRDLWDGDREIESKKEREIERERE